MTRTSTWAIIATVLMLAGGRDRAPEKVQLTIGTLHAAALTNSRATDDSTDAPFFVLSVIGPHGSSSAVLPDTGKRTIRADEALGARPLTEFTLVAGDSVQVMVSVLENTRILPADAALVAGAPITIRSASLPERADEVNKLVAPLVKRGAQVIGSVSLLLTNEGGSIYWRRLDCVETCEVLTVPARTALPAAKGQPSVGVVELSGNGGTYHLQLSANRGG